MDEELKNGSLFFNRGTVYYKHMIGTAGETCLYWGGWAQRTIKEMKDHGISAEMIQAILDICRQCKAKMKRKKYHPKVIIARFFLSDSTTFGDTFSSDQTLVLVDYLKKRV